MPLQSQPTQNNHRYAGSDSSRKKKFFQGARKVVDRAFFVYTSLPQVNQETAQRTVLELETIQFALQTMLNEDGVLSPALMEAMLKELDSMLVPLQEFISAPPPPNDEGMHFEYTGKRGRPRQSIDLERILELRDIGASWRSIAKAIGTTRQTLYNRLREAGLSTARPAYTFIDDNELDTHLSDITLLHPFIGIKIAQGHLRSRNINVPYTRVRESLHRVDAIGVSIRWATAIKRRVYSVRGANALWHMDGNEKLRPWGFYVHGCIDGYSRRIIYLHCATNKRAATVTNLFMTGVRTFGWPSRMRADFGTENNGVEKAMVEKWGEAHRAYLRGKSLHNIRIERLWRDVRKDCLESFRRTFQWLAYRDLLDMDDPVHRIALFIVYHQRVQDSLDRTMSAWNNHAMRTVGNKSPLLVYELSKEEAKRRGYWGIDPGDFDDEAAHPLYGCDGDAPFPPPEEAVDIDVEREHGLRVNSDEEITWAKGVLGGGFHADRDDGNWGIDVYLDAVKRLKAEQFFSDDNSSSSEDEE